MPGGRGARGEGRDLLLLHDSIQPSARLPRGSVASETSSPYHRDTKPQWPQIHPGCEEVPVRLLDPVYGRAAAKKGSSLQSGFLSTVATIIEAITVDGSTFQASMPWGAKGHCKTSILIKEINKEREKETPDGKGQSISRPGPFKLYLSQLPQGLDPSLPLACAVVGNAYRSPELT